MLKIVLNRYIIYYISLKIVNLLYRYYQETNRSLLIGVCSFSVDIKVRLVITSEKELFAVCIISRMPVASTQVQ
jgi:hypothetical protein